MSRDMPSHHTGGNVGQVRYIVYKVAFFSFKPNQKLFRVRNQPGLLKHHHMYSTCMLQCGWSVACTRAEAGTRHQTPTSLLDKCHGVLLNCIPQGEGASLARGGRTTPRSCYTILPKQSLHPHSTSCIKLEQNVGPRTEVADILLCITTERQCQCWAAWAAWAVASMVTGVAWSGLAEVRP